MSENRISAPNMGAKYKPTLCFGTFFLLICQSRNNLGTGKRNQYDSSLREVSEAEIFNALMCIVYGKDNYSVISHGEGVYKQCRKNKKIPCQKEAAVLKAFNAKCDDYEHYKGIIDNVNDKLLSLLDPEKDGILVKSIIALIVTAVCDDNGTEQIDETVKFQISQTSKKSKWQLANDELDISLPHFLLDVYRYILNNCKNNMVGQATYEDWCPKEQGMMNNTQRPLKKGPDVSVVRHIPKVFRKNIESQAITELNTALNDMSVLDEKKFDSRITQDENTRTDIYNYVPVIRVLEKNGTLKKQVVIQENRPLLIGRLPNDCSLILENDPYVSAIHCSVRCDAYNNLFIVVDLNSMNGTFLEDGTRLQGKCEYPLAPGSRFKVGHTILYVGFVNTEDCSNCNAVTQASQILMIQKGEKGQQIGCASNFTIVYN